MDGIHACLPCPALPYFIDVVERDLLRMYPGKPFTGERVPNVDIALRMLLAGVPMADPFLASTLWNLKKSELKKLGEGKIPIQRSFYLKGTALPQDFRDRLRPDQIVVIMEGHFFVRKKVVVFKPPGIHFGDPRVMEAVYFPEIEGFVGPVSELQYGLFFSVDGERSPAAMMSGGSDYDGDAYLIIDEPEIVNNFKASREWTPGHVVKAKIPLQTSLAVLNSRGYEEVFAKEMVNSIYSASLSQVGRLNNEWLAWADLLLDPTIRLSTSEREEATKHMNYIADCFYTALDSSPTDSLIPVDKSHLPPSWPDYLIEERRERGSESDSTGSERSNGLCGQLGSGRKEESGNVLESSKRNIRVSSSVLKKMYDRVRDLSPIQGLDARIPEGMELDVDFVNSCGDYDLYRRKWAPCFAKYKKEVKEACTNSFLSKEERNRRIHNITQQYVKVFYEAENMGSSAKAHTEELFEEACSIYKMVYTRIQESKRKPEADMRYLEGIRFPWMVAGHVLCLLKANKRSHPCPIAIATTAFLLD